jgi:hypothetical protein
MPASHDPEPDDRSRRIEALRNLAQQGDIQSEPESDALPTATTTSAAPSLAPVSTQRSRKALLITAISALVLVAVAGGLIARTISARSPSTTTNPLQTFTTSILHPGGNDAACPQDVAWSPDGATVAFLGYQLSCASSDPAGYSYHAGVVALYDAAKGVVTGTILPDPIIASALGLKPPTVATPRPFSAPDDHNTSQQVVDYSHVLWSPDGKQLAITFSVLVATGVTHGGIVTKMVEGVLLMSPSGGNTRVLSHTMAQNEAYSGLWNLSTGEYIAASGSATLPDSANTSWFAAQALTPPAPAYQWDDTGHLQAISASSPVGQADGATAFSIWQPGDARLISQIYSDNLQQPPQTLKTPVEVWDSPFAAWSANGKYLLAESGIFSWRVAVPGAQAPDKATLAKVGLGDAPVMQAHDAALVAVLKTYHDLSVNPEASNTPLYMAWSPDGKRLAVEASVYTVRGQTSPQIKDFAVQIYDCASGKLLGTLIPNLTLNGDYSGTAFLRWSADGSRLLLYNPLLSGAQIWGAAELPK